MAVSDTGDVRLAITRMLTLRHPRVYRRSWMVLGIVVVAAGLLAFARGAVSPVELAAGGVVAVAAVFVLLRRLLGWLALSIALGLGLGLLPLFGVLGLELSLATALFAGIMGADVGCGLARELATIPPSGVRRAAYPGRTLARGALASAGVAAAIVSAVAVVAALRGIVVPTCDWRFGILAFVALPLATAALFGAIGHAVGALLGPRRVGPAIVAQLPALGVAIAALYRFYSEPPVYTYNALIGYFPGNMYDENVELTSALAWSRLAQAAWVVVAIALVAWRFDVASYRVRLRAPRPAGRRFGALGAAAAAAGVALVLQANGGRLGFAVDAEDLEEALGGRLETEHFIIYYTPTPEVKDDLAVIAEDHEFRLAQVVAQIGVAPREKIVSFYFADRDQKARLHGSRDVEMAKPWRHEIYLDHRAFPHASLRHEIAHAVAAEFGDPWFGVASRRIAGLPVLANPGVIEGLAVALDWPGSYTRPNPHESVRIIEQLGPRPSLDSLLGLTFFTTSSAKGYTIAGSFLRFLLDRYGAPAVRDLYRSGGDFEATYGMPRARLEAEWDEMLQSIAVPERTVKASAERFRGDSFLGKQCVHAIAKRRDHAAEVYAEGDKAGAIELMRQVCDEARGEPAYRIQLGDFLYSVQGPERGEALWIWAQIAADERGVTPTLRARAYERLVRAAARSDDFARAAQFADLGRELAVSEDDRRQLDAMAFAFAHEGPAGPFLRTYFFPPPSQDKPVTPVSQAEAAIAAEPELALAHYLLGLQRYNQRDFAGAARELALSLGHELPGLAFVRNAARVLAVAAYRTHDYGNLALATGVLSRSEMTSGDRLLAHDWQDRVQFDLHHD